MVCETLYVTEVLDALMRDEIMFIARLTDASMCK